MANQIKIRTFVKQIIQNTLPFFICILAFTGNSTDLSPENLKQFIFDEQFQNDCSPVIYYQDIEEDSTETDSIMNEALKALHGESTQKDTVAPVNLSPADSLYSALRDRENTKYILDPDSNVWCTLSQDYLDAYPLPHPLNDSTCKWNVHIGPKGVPMVRWITFPEYGRLLVTVHSCSTSIQLSCWRKSDSVWMPVGNPSILNCKSPFTINAIFVGDSNATCIGIAHEKRGFELYLLHPDSLVNVFHDSIPYSYDDKTDYYVNFIYGYSAANFGCFAAESASPGQGGWEQFRVYYWNGRVCKQVNIPGVGDAAIRNNRVMKAHWLEHISKRQNDGAELLVSKRYIDDYTLFPGVYTFNGQKWSHVSSEKYKDVIELIPDQLDRQMFRILYDSAAFHAFPSSIADTIALIEREAKFKRKPSLIPVINFMMMLAVHSYKAGDYDRAVQMIRWLHYPYGDGDSENEPINQLEAIKALFISVGDLEYVTFADTLLSYAGAVSSAEWGDSVHFQAMPASPPHHRIPEIDNYIQELWPKALKDIQDARNGLTDAKKRVVEKHQRYFELQKRVQKVNHSPTIKNVSSMYDYFRSNFSMPSVETFLLAIRDPVIKEALEKYADTAIVAIAKKSAETGLLPADLPTGVLLNYCTKSHPDLFSNTHVAWDTADYPRTIKMLSIGLSSGDSTALCKIAEMLRTHDELKTKQVYEALTPEWCTGPIPPACTFAFDTIWKYIPTSETLLKLVPGIIQNAFHSPDSVAKVNLNKLHTLVDNTGDSVLVMTMRAIEVNSLTQMLSWDDKIKIDKGLRNTPIDEDTIYTLILEYFEAIRDTDGFDFRVIPHSLYDGGKNLIQWAVAHDKFTSHKELLLQLMLCSGIRGYDTLMIPLTIQTFSDNTIHTLNRLDYCYILTLGSHASRMKLLQELQKTQDLNIETSMLRLTLVTSKKEKLRILKEIPFHSPDTLSSDNWHEVEWAPIKYLLLLKDRHLLNVQWDKLFFFQSFSSAYAIKDWFFAVAVTTLKNSKRSSDILNLAQNNRFPLEFGCEVMKLKELEMFSRSILNDPQSDIELRFEYPIIEQVLSQRLFYEQRERILLRFVTSE
jgi:hypothetical protein